ncbi:MAG: hypothetical protein NTV24_01170 [Candidatus Woesebacteria bacterium]|nr:hypothetical protein [Candidatus Woesebacteria bacterium]
MNIITEIRPKLENNKKVKKFLSSHWGSFYIASKGKLTDASKISRVMVKDNLGQNL